MPPEHPNRAQAASQVEHQMFIVLLSDMPRLQPFWDFAIGELDVQGLRSAIGAMSSGEQHVARFLAGVWLGSNDEFGFDMIAAAKDLDSNHLKTISDWLARPLFP